MRKGSSGAVAFLHSDHLGSASLMTGQTGHVLRQTRYEPYGKVRWTSGAQLSDYGFTGQRREDYLKLVQMGSRWYDPELGRWLSPDTIIPDQNNPLSWDRYSYVFENPVRYNDPSGHCPWCVLAVLVIGAIVLTGDMPNITSPLPTANGNASNLLDLLQLGMEQADHANITGEGLQSLQNDPSVQAAQGRIVDEIRSQPVYGEQPFTLSDDFGRTSFTANGDSGRWWTDAQQGNPAFYMVHTGTLYATNTEVSADGTIATTWKVEDQFDYLPAWNENIRSGSNYWAYNGYAQIVAPIYHGLLQAEPFITNAYGMKSFFRKRHMKRKI